MIWGISGPKKSVTLELPDVECPKCSDVGEFYAHGYTRYLHIFWIPIFPVGKRVRGECESCDKTFKNKKRPQEVLDNIAYVKKQVKVPWTHFIGSIIVLPILIWLIYSLSTYENHDLDYLAEPQVGDIYIIEEDSEYDMYNTWKVVDFDIDSVYVVKNDLQIQGQWTMTLNYDKEENQRFFDDTTGYVRNDLFQMKQRGEIYSVKRDIE